MTFSRGAGLSSPEEARSVSRILQNDFENHYTGHVNVINSTKVSAQPLNGLQDFTEHPENAGTVVLAIGTSEPHIFQHTGSEK
jgi:hypothetical protein